MIFRILYSEEDSGEGQGETLKFMDLLELARLLRFKAGITDKITKERRNVNGKQLKQ